MFGLSAFGFRYSEFGTGNHQGFSPVLPSARVVFGTSGFPRVITIRIFDQKTKTKNSVRARDELSAAFNGRSSLG